MVTPINLEANMIKLNIFVYNINIFNFIRPLSAYQKERVAFVFKIYYTTMKNEVFYEERRDHYTNTKTPDIKEITLRNHCK